jgi:hypothetical protein
MRDAIADDAPIRMDVGPRDENWMLVHDLYWRLAEFRERRGPRHRERIAELVTVLSTMGHDPNADYRFSPATKEGYVYVVRFQKYVKIGFSRSPDTRIKMIRASLPEPIKVVSIQPGSEVDERFTHRAFAAYRQHQDWFREEGELAAWINGGCKL